MVGAVPVAGTGGAGRKRKNARACCALYKVRTSNGICSTGVTRGAAAGRTVNLAAAGMRVFPEPTV